MMFLAEKNVRNVLLAVITMHSLLHHWHCVMNVLPRVSAIFPAPSMSLCANFAPLGPTHLRRAQQHAILAGLDLTLKDQAKKAVTHARPDPLQKRAAQLSANLALLVPALFRMVQQNALLAELDHIQSHLASSSAICARLEPSENKSAPARKQFVRTALQGIFQKQDRLYASDVLLELLLMKAKRSAIRAPKGNFRSLVTVSIVPGSRTV